MFSENPYAKMQEKTQKVKKHVFSTENYFEWLKHKLNVGFDGKSERNENSVCDRRPADHDVASRFVCVCVSVYPSL